MIKSKLLIKEIFLGGIDLKTLQGHNNQSSSESFIVGFFIFRELATAPQPDRDNNQSGVLINVQLCPPDYGRKNCLLGWNFLNRRNAKQWAGPNPAQKQDSLYCVLILPKSRVLMTNSYFHQKRSNSHHLENFSQVIPTCSTLLAP